MVTSTKPRSRRQGAEEITGVDIGDKVGEGVEHTYLQG